MNTPATLAEALAQVLSEDLPLRDRLDAYARELRRLEPAVAVAYDALVARLQANDVGRDAPNLGDVMPPFLMPDQDGHLVALEELLDSGPLVVSFNRGHWCPFCRIELDALARSADRIGELGARIVTIIPERSAFAAIARQRGVTFPILSDIDLGYALSLGLVFWIGDSVIEQMKRFDRSLPEYQGNDGWCLPIPATFVVGRDGRVKARLVDPDFRSGRLEIATITEALEKECERRPENVAS